MLAKMAILSSFITKYTEFLLVMQSQKSKKMSKNVFNNVHCTKDNPKHRFHVYLS